jgi:hypothetical protein
MNRRDRLAATLSRRRLLSLSAAGVAALAGCGGTNARNASNAGGSDGAATLGYVRVTNRHDEAHTMHVLVERDGEVVFWSSYVLDAGSDSATSTYVEGPWTDEQANYTVHFRIDERSEWRTFSTARTDLPCYGLEGRVSADGELGVWVEHTPDECRSTTTQG